mmetsp:Transcript_4687/g.9045  ORF Transcript_4687/g.9045 Transcript_4687/m.9045 type:complete len:178 (-) Transcript_4687:2864-3397(-)
MIDYFKGVYGLNLLGRIHGSSLYKGSLVGLVAASVYLGIALLRSVDDGDGEDEDDLDHPYGVGVLVTSVSFLITFRANYGYQRYWEACVSSNYSLEFFECRFLVRVPRKVKRVKFRFPTPGRVGRGPGEGFRWIQFSMSCGRYIDGGHRTTTRSGGPRASVKSKIWRSAIPIGSAPE